MFNGFSTAASDFLWGVRFNNYRSWFMEHKQEYLTLVQQPLKELAQEVFEQFQEKYPDLDMELHVSRIYRDARRLHGKGPYKDHLWFSIRKPTSTHWTERPVFWFEIRPEGYGYGMGMWMAKPFTMECYRKEILEHPERLLPLAEKLAAQDVFVLDSPEYKRPKEGNPDGILANWYNRKGFSISCDRDWDSLLESGDLVKTMVDGFDFLMPYYDYFMGICDLSRMKQFMS
ncbi:MAG: DUF2461 domain-containing protein [Oscillospiraceae bacterium]|nr:DUF2461 domain-containing protein [Oscillospiraceae bacterium]